MKKEDIIKIAEPLISEGILEGQSDYDIAYNIARMIIEQKKANPVENRAMPKIADAVHYKITEYEMWLRLPRYQTDESNEYYADITAILEDLREILKFVKSNFTA